MYKAYYIVLFCLICSILPVSAQVDTTVTEQFSFQNMGKIKKDTIPPVNPLMAAKDTSSQNILFSDTLNLKFATDGLDQEASFEGDSTWLDVEGKKQHLYGKAKVIFENMTLSAGYIIFDMENDVAEAFAIKDARGKNVQEPKFVMGENTFSYRQLKFNFKTKKGIVHDAISNEGEFFLHGSKTKFISKDSDSLLVDDEIYNTDALITTCNLEHPHYGIRTKKLKVVPNKLAVVGFSQLEIAGIPLPIFLPFGFFPLSQGQSSGLILPNNYEYDKDLGLGFKEIGYYFPINDYMDLKVTGDIYTRGTYRIRGATNYRKRYAFNGSVNVGYANNKVEDAGTGLINSNTSFNISISHNQDAKAHPYRTIGGRINIQTNNYQQRNFNDAGSQINNRLNSNFYFKHSMPGTPFSFTTGLAHDQNNQTRAVNITLPDIKLNMNTIFPFKRKNATGDDKWYEKFSLKYDLAMKNLVRATDTTLFTQETLDNLQTGISHKASTNASFNVLSYFNFSPSANYDELWYFSSRQVDFDASPILDTISSELDPEGVRVFKVDTIFGQQIESVQRSFQPVRLFNASFRLSTQIFGTKTFSKGWIRGVRHVMKPSVSFNFSPDSRSRYLELADTDSREEFNNPLEYNPFQRGAIGAPSLREKQMAIRFSVQNVFEGKYFSKKDSTEKKFKLLNSFNFSGGYNFAADSLNWDDLRFTGNTKFFGVTSLSFNGIYTPYVYDGNKRTSETLWSQKKKVLEFRRFQANFSTNLSFTKIKSLFTGGKKKSTSTGSTEKSSTSRTKKQAKLPEDSFIDWFDRFAISHRFNMEVAKTTDGKKEYRVTAHSITLRGSIPLTKKWNMTLGNITYNFKTKSFVYPTLGISRDLHCWNMNFNWYPRNGVYSFFIGVKSNSLSFVKYNYGQTNAFNSFR